MLKSLIRRAALAAVIAVPVTSAAQSQPVSIYGIALGEPLTLPKCPTKTVGDMWEFDDLARLTTTCAMQQWRSQGSFHEGEWFEIHSPTDRHPPLVDGYFSVWVSDGRVEDIAFGTSGVQIQDAVRNALVEKLGPVTSSDVEKVQNRFGATFDIFHARWRIGDVSARFDGAVNGRTDGGEVEIQTPRGRDMRKHEAEFIEQRRLKL